MQIFYSLRCQINVVDIMRLAKMVISQRNLSGTPLVLSVEHKGRWHVSADLPELVRTTFDALIFTVDDILNYGERYQRPGPDIDSQHGRYRNRYRPCRLSM